MEASPPRSSPSTSVRVTSPTVNAKILHVPLDVRNMTSTQGNQLTNHRTRIPQPITNNNIPVTSQSMGGPTNHLTLPTNLIANHRGGGGGTSAAPTNNSTSSSTVPFGSRLPPTEMVFHTHHDSKANYHHNHNHYHHMHKVVGNGPIAMTAQPLEVYGNLTKIVQPITTRAASQPNVVTVQGALLKREYLRLILRNSYEI